MGKLFKAGDRKNLALGGKAPRCPLCDDWMGKQYVPEKRCFVFACHNDKILIRVDDPFVGRWEEVLHRTTGGLGIPCPAPGCEGKMRYFATQVGYMRALCPKCGAKMEARENVDKETRDKVNATPDAPGIVQ